MIKEFFKYVLQSVAGMLGISVYILADTFFISIHSGADGLTVLNLLLPVYGLIYAIGAMIGVGSATRYAIRKSRGEKDIGFYFTHSLSWCMIMSIPFILLGIFAPEKVLYALGADRAIALLGTDYLRIVLTAAPFFMMNYTFTAFARNDNAPAAAMAASLSGSLFNIIFDYIFMFPMGMGLAGAALATSVSPIVTMAVCTSHYLGKNNGIEFKWKFPSARQLFSCCQLGFSAFVGEISSAAATLIFNVLILRLAGNTGVAAYGVIANTALVATCVFNGIAQGAQPLISKSYGGERVNEVKMLLKSGIIVSLAAEIIIVAAAWGFTDVFIGIFNSEGNEMLQSYAHGGMRYYFLGYIFAGVNIMLISCFSAVGRAKEAFIASILRGVLAIALCAVIMSAIWGMNGVWLSFIASEIITFAVILIMKI